MSAALACLDDITEEASLKLPRDRHGLYLAYSRREAANDATGAKVTKIVDPTGAATLAGYPDERGMKNRPSHFMHIGYFCVPNAALATSPCLKSDDNAE